MNIMSHANSEVCDRDGLRREMLTRYGYRARVKLQARGSPGLGALVLCSRQQSAARTGRHDRSDEASAHCSAKKVQDDIYPRTVSHLREN